MLLSYVFIKKYDKFYIFRYSNYNYYFYIKYRSKINITFCGQHVAKAFVNIFFYLVYFLNLFKKIFYLKNLILFKNYENCDYLNLYQQHVAQNMVFYEYIITYYRFCLNLFNFNIFYI